MTVQSVKRDVFEVPESAMREMHLEQAMQTLYFHGVSVETYKKFYAEQYAKDQAQEGRERYALSAD